MSEAATSRLGLGSEGLVHIPVVREWKREGMGIDWIGMGGNGNAKSHSRSSLLRTNRGLGLVRVLNMRFKILS